MTFDPASASRFKRADAESYDRFTEEFDQFEEIRKPLEYFVSPIVAKQEARENGP